MEHAIKEIRTVDDSIIGIISEGNSTHATYFGTDFRIKKTTYDWNMAHLAMRVFIKKLEKAGGSYPALSQDTKELRLRYSKHLSNINEIDNISITEEEYLSELSQYIIELDTVIGVAEYRYVLDR